MSYLPRSGAKPQILVDMTFLARGEDFDIYQDPSKTQETYENIGFPTVVVDIFRIPNPITLKVREPAMR